MIFEKMIDAGYYYNSIQELRKVVDTEEQEDNVMELEESSVY